jgi:Zn-dependent protease with chaperone function
VVKPLLKLVDQKDREYQFFVLDSEVANAFSHPGGYVCVSRKLLEMIPKDEDNLLEFVLGHEIAHVELHHALACLNAPDVRKFSDGTVQKLYFLIIPYGYPKEFEYAADAWIYRRMKQLLRSEHDCLKFLRILDTYAKAHDFENGRGKPEELLKEQRAEAKGDRTFSPIDNHLRSHPAAYDRLGRLKELRAASRP